MPEEYDGETGMFSPVDKYYRETRDIDYYAPFGLEYTEKETVNGVVKYHFEEWSEGEDEEETSEEGELEKADHEEEDLNEELKALLEDAKSEVPQDLKEGKHRIIPERVKEIKEDVKEGESVSADAKEESEKESSDSDAKSSSDSDSKNSEDGKVFKERKIWYEYFYLKFIENLQIDDEYEDTTEYYPAAMITDPDLDYDEADPEGSWEIPADEVKGLKEDLKMDISKLGNYVPIWVHVESVKSRKDVAKQIFEEEQKAIAEEAAAKKVAEEEAAAKKVIDEEAATKKAAEDEVAAKMQAEKAQSEPLNLQNIELAAKEVTDETKAEVDAAKPQRKLSAKGSPKKKSPKKEGEKSPK